MLIAGNNNGVGKEHIIVVRPIIHSSFRSESKKENCINARVPPMYTYTAWTRANRTSAGKRCAKRHGGRGRYVHVWAYGACGGTYTRRFRHSYRVET